MRQTLYDMQYPPDIMIWDVFQILLHRRFEPNSI